MAIFTCFGVVFITMFTVVLVKSIFGFIVNKD